MEKIFSYIDSRRDEFLAFWEDICNAEGVAEDKAALDAVADVIADFAARLGMCVTRIPFENCGDFLVIDTRPDAEKGACFLAHMDTVHKKGSFGSPAVRIEGDKIIGPGVIDCKGGIAIALLAMSSLLQNGYKKNCRLLLTSDEEISNRLGGEREMDVIRESVSGYKAAFNCEVAGIGEAVVSRKGILRYRYDITGVAAHAGIDYFGGASAVREAAHKILALESLSKQGGTTFNCGIIKGGALSNIVPERCEITVDVRVNSAKAMREAIGILQEIAEKSFVKGTKTELHFISKREPMLRNGDTENLFRLLKEVGEKHSLETLTPVESGGGSDSAYTQLAGVPSICAVGATGEFCHTTREYANISSLTTRAKLLAAATVELK
jgi:glutamate carboxypeptidase